MQLKKRFWLCEAELVEASLSWEIPLLHHTGQLLLQLVVLRASLFLVLFSLRSLRSNGEEGLSVAAEVQLTRGCRLLPWLSPPVPTCTLQFSH